MKNPAAVALGSIKSPRKAASSAANGKRGGRPSLLSEFLRGFGEASGQSDPDSHWAAYSRSLSDRSREAIESGGYEAGLHEGAAYKNL